MKRHEIRELFLGGPGSGHHGHRGIPGQVGGSASGSLGTFGVWSEERTNELVALAQKAFPEFYARAEEHVGEEAAIADEFIPGSSMKESEIPDEIVALTQWDLENRTGGSDHVKLYSGIYDHSKRPGTPQPDSGVLQDKFDQEGFRPMSSFTTNPQTAYGFSEGVGSVIVATVPIADVQVSHFVVPAMGAAFGGGELEFLVSPSKNMPFNIRSADRFERTIMSAYKKNNWSSKRLIGYKGARPGKTWEGT